MIDLLIKGAIAIAIIGFLAWALHAVDKAVGEHYIAPVRVAMQKEIDLEKARADQAEGVNDGLRKDVDDTKVLVGSCNARVDSLVVAENEATQQAEQAIAAVRARSATDKVTIDELTKIAKGAPTPGDFCEQARKADVVLTDAAHDQRMRVKPKQDAVGVSKDSRVETGGQGSVH